MSRFYCKSIFSRVNLSSKHACIACQKPTSCLQNWFCSHQQNKIWSSVPKNTYGHKLLASISTQDCRLHVVRTMHTESAHRNKLSQEKSPYLLQHASNPVDWYPWGKEAFDKAERENKLIFLSVGYSTCHWCHVMERESFENEEIGKILNDNFVSIKVDREERPDVDKVYMAFVQAVTGSGGWPMSVWLTPNLKPVVGGTYFPPDDRYLGRPGFKSILLGVAEKWKESRDKIEEQGSAILDALMHSTQAESVWGENQATQSCVDSCFEMLQKTFDSKLGGFTAAPKFPQPVNFKFLLHYYGSKPNSLEREKALDMTVFTLKMMAKGGIHDHISKGFHRYSTDKFWHVPHFEKMLYDQAQLSIVYLVAYQITREAFFEETARDIFSYVSRDLSHPAGGFYSAEDADSLPTTDSEKKREGAFCVWTWDEAHSILSDVVNGIKEADIFCHHYGMLKEGNVDPNQDPHDELKGQNVLIIKGSLEETAAHFSVDAPFINSVLERSRQKLFNVRQKRPKPHLDDKMVAAWNGLMMSGFARGGQILQDPSLTDRALKSAQFLKDHMYEPDTKVLLRSCYTSENSGVTQILQPIEAFADDYAFVIRGLMDLYEACYDDKWLKWAEELQDTQNRLFWDEEEGGYFSSPSGDRSIVLRMKDEQDGAEPSANSFSAMNLLRLSHFLNRTELHAMGTKLFQIFYQRLSTSPMAAPSLVCALGFVLSSPKQVIIFGEKHSSETQAMFKILHENYLPNKVLIHADQDGAPFLKTKIPVLKSLKKLDGKTTAYVCENYACSLPVNSAEELKKFLVRKGK